MRIAWPLVFLLAGGCATPDLATAPPVAADIAILEELRVIAPLADITNTPGKYVVEFAPKVETRNVKCTPAVDETYTCDFESRVKPFGREFGSWEKRSEKLRRDARGNWWFDGVATAVRS